MSVAELFGQLGTRLAHAGIPYMLTGSFARACHGRPRAMQEIDVGVAPGVEVDPDAGEFGQLREGRLGVTAGPVGIGTQ